MLWKKSTSLAELNALCQHTAISHLGIEFSEIGENFLTASLTMSEKCTQPFGLLHGGISATLAETVASAAAMLCCEDNEIAVGKELNISHLKAVRSGKIFAKATPLHLGKSSQVWQIELNHPELGLVAVSRLTTYTLTTK